MLCCGRCTEGCRCVRLKTVAAAVGNAEQMCLALMQIDVFICSEWWICVLCNPAQRVINQEKFCRLLWKSSLLWRVLRRKTYSAVCARFIFDFLYAAMQRVVQLNYFGLIGRIVHVRLNTGWSSAQRSALAMRNILLCVDHIYGLAYSLIRILSQVTDRLTCISRYSQTCRCRRYS